MDNPVYTLPGDVRLPVPDLVPADGHPAWNPRTIDDQGSIYNDLTAPYAVIQKPHTRNNPEELDVAENFVYANSHDSSLSNGETVNGAWRSEDTARQLYREDTPTALNTQPTGLDTECAGGKDIEMMENELYQQNTD